MKHGLIRLTYGLVVVLMSLSFVPRAFATSGYTWTQTSPHVNNTMFGISTSASGQYVLAIGMDNFLVTEYVYLSTNNGASWIDLSSIDSHNDFTSVAVSQSGKYMAIATDASGLYTSSNYGATWSNSSLPLGANWNAMAMSADGQHIAVATVGAIYVSSNNGASWTRASIGGNPDWQYLTVSANGQYMAGDDYGGSLYTSSDYGATWAAQASAGTHNWTGLTASGDGQYLAAAVSQGNLYTSNNFGASWTAHTVAGGVNWGGMASSLSGQYLAVGTNSTAVYTSSDYGSTWAQQTVSGSSSTFTVAMPALGDYIYAGDTGKVDIGHNPSLANGNQAVTSNVVNGGSVFVGVTSSTTALTCANGVTESSLTKSDPDYTYPLGLTNVCFATLNANDQVTLTFVTNLTPSQVTARDYNTATQTYTSVAGAVITETTYNGQPALQLTYTIADNGLLDSSQLTGLVTDPVGLAVQNVVTTASTASAPDTGYGAPQTSGSLKALAVLSVGSLGLGCYALIRSKRASRISQN